MLRFTQFALFLYVTGWIWLRITLYYDDKIAQPHPPGPAPTFTELRANSGGYHGVRLRGPVTVVGKPNPLLDFFWIDNYLVCDDSGTEIRVFGKFPKPHPGTQIRMEADFRQLPEYAPFGGCGLMLRNWEELSANRRSPDSPDPAPRVGGFGQ
jgi:hypothetical protein